MSSPNLAVIARLGLIFLRDFPNKWEQLAGQLFYLESCLDRQQHVHDSQMLTFECDLCPCPRPAFSTAKALAQHKRIKHQMRNAVRFYIDGSGVCPACKNVYHTRYRVLTHIQNPQKPECKLYILRSGSVRALPNDVVQELDELDNIAIREARKQGHTHPKVKAPARRADGTCIGCART